MDEQYGCNKNDIRNGCASRDLEECGAAGYFVAQVQSRMPIPHHLFLNLVCLSFHDQQIVLCLRQIDCQTRCAYRAPLAFIWGGIHHLGSRSTSHVRYHLVPRIISTVEFSFATVLGFRRIYFGAIDGRRSR